MPKTIKTDIRNLQERLGFFKIKILNSFPGYLGNDTTAQLELDGGWLYIKYHKNDEGNNLFFLIVTTDRFHPRDNFDFAVVLGGHSYKKAKEDFEKLISIIEANAYFGFDYNEMLESIQNNYHK